VVFNYRVSWQSFDAFRGIWLPYFVAARLRQAQGYAQHAEIINYSRILVNLLNDDHAIVSNNRWPLPDTRATTFEV